MLMIYMKVKSMNNQKDMQSLLVKFIGPRANYYLNSNNRKIEFHWPGLLFGGLWLLYRKMYFNFFIILAFTFFITILAGIINLEIKYLIWGVSWIPSIILGFFGKSIYLNFAQSKIKKYIKSPIYNEKVFLELGGTNWSVPILWLIICIIITLMATLPYVRFGTNFYS